MEKQPEKSTEEPCDKKGHCCGSYKAIGALVLLLLGGVIGFLMGRCGSMRGDCGHGGMMMKKMCAYSAPQMTEEAPENPHK